MKKMNLNYNFSIETQLQKTQFLHSNEKIINTVHNNDKKDPKLLVITNIRMIVFDFLEKEQEVRFNENIKIFNFDQYLLVTSLSHFMGKDLIVGDSKTKIIIKKIDNEEVNEIIQLVNSLKVSQNTQRNNLDTNIRQTETNFSEKHSNNNSHQKSFKHLKTSHEQKHLHSVPRGHKVAFTENQRYCRHCGIKYNLSETSCQNCGESFTLTPLLDESSDLEEKKLCPYCNAKLTSSDLFCSECGMKV